MCQVVISGIPSKKRVEMLDSVVNVIFDGQLGKVPVVKCLSILVGALLCNLCGGEHGLCRLEVESVRACGLLPAACVGDRRFIRRNARPESAHQ